MAGLGRKEFNSGDILLASEVQGYLQDQAVMVFDDATARGSAIPNPSEGMLTYNKDTDALELYDGSAFGSISNAGLIHINTTTFSAVSAQSVNNVFSGTYDYYRFLLDLTAGGAIVNLRLRVSGTDASGGNYSYGGHENFVNNGTYFNYQASATTQLQIGNSNSGRLGTSMDIRRPFLAQETQFAISTIRSDGTINSATGNGIHTLSTSYDGFTIYPASGTITGTLRVYGYKN